MNRIVNNTLVILATAGMLVAGCAAPPSPVPSPSIVPSPEILCDSSRFKPTPTLTCGPAILAAQAVLPPTHPPILREEFRWGGLCPQGAPCVPPLGNAGIVIFDFVSGPSTFVYVDANAAGGAAASSPAPFPSGY